MAALEIDTIKGEARRGRLSLASLLQAILNTESKERENVLTVNNAILDDTAQGLNNLHDQKSQLAVEAQSILLTTTAASELPKAQEKFQAKVVGTNARILELTDKIGLKTKENDGLNKDLEALGELGAAISDILGRRNIAVGQTLIRALFGQPEEHALLETDLATQVSAMIIGSQTRELKEKETKVEIILKKHSRGRPKNDESKKPRMTDKLLELGITDSILDQLGVKKQQLGIAKTHLANVLGITPDDALRIIVTGDKDNTLGVMMGNEYSGTREMTAKFKSLSVKTNPPREDSQETLNEIVSREQAPLKKPVELTNLKAALTFREGTSAWKTKSYEKILVVKGTPPNTLRQSEQGKAYDEVRDSLNYEIYLVLNYARNSGLKTIGDLFKDNENINPGVIDSLQSLRAAAKNVGIERELDLLPVDALKRISTAVKLSNGLPHKPHDVRGLVEFMKNDNNGK